MSTQQRLTKAERKIEALVKGWIEIEIFRMAVPVFISEADRVAYLNFHKASYAPMTPEQRAAALAGWALYPDQSKLIFMVLPVGVPQSTWVHEASHVVDFVFEHLGIDTGIEVTEVRAYMLGHIFASIEDIMAPLLAARPEGSENTPPPLLSPA